MDTGFETIGNATLICYDKGPVLVTDPWLFGDAYFGSWSIGHEIPEEQMDAIKRCEYVWVSHGHPDHLSMKSLRELKDKKILIPDHVGGRIADDLKRLGFNVTVLADRKWTTLSPRISVQCISDYFQDAVLLVDVDGVLVADFNDAGERGWGRLVQKTVREYKHSVLLKLFGYGDADMINYFDEEGNRIEPRAAQKPPVGQDMSICADTYGFTHVIPFSSLHKYQRSDSVWANQYLTPIDAYSEGFTSTQCELLPAFASYNSATKNFDSIKVAKNPDVEIASEEFGDNWSEPLEKGENEKLETYFNSISHLGRAMDFINVRVGGEDNIIQLSKRGFKKGIKFEVPRNSLMRAIRYEIFDDLLIGNFMKTTLIGKWPNSQLYPDFTPFVAKYADNGRAKSPAELKSYFGEYRHRDPIEYLRHRIQYRLASAAMSQLDRESEVYLRLKKVWWFLDKKIFR